MMSETALATSFHLAPLAGRGRILRVAKNPGEGGSPRVLLRAESPSPQPSPRKRGEAKSDGQQLGHPLTLPAAA